MNDIGFIFLLLKKITLASVDVFVLSITLLLAYNIQKKHFIKITVFSSSQCNFKKTVWSLIKCVKSAMFSKMVNQQFLTLRTNISVQDCLFYKWSISLHWRHNGPDGVSNHQPHDCSLSRLFRQRSKKASKLRVTGLCAGGEFPAQMASYGKCFHLMTSSCSDKDLCYCWLS